MPTSCQPHDPSVCLVNWHSVPTPANVKIFYVASGVGQIDRIRDRQLMESVHHALHISNGSNIRLGHEPCLYLSTIID